RIALQAGADAARAGPRQFLHRDDPHEIVDFGTAIFLGKAQAKQSDFGGLLIEHARKPAGLVPFMGIGLDFPFDKPAHYLAIAVVFAGVERACHFALPPLITVPRGTRWPGIP